MNIKLTYSLLFLCLSFVVNAQLEHLEWQSWDRGASVANINSTSLFQDLKREYILVNFSDKLTSTQHQTLKAQDVSLLEYFGNQTYLVSLPKKYDYSALGQFGVGKFYKGKLSDVNVLHLAEEDIPDYSKEGDQLVLSVQYPKDLEETDFIRLCAKNGVEVILSNGVNNIVHVAVSSGELDKVYHLPFLYNIETLSPPGEPEDQRGRNLHRVSSLAPPNTFESGYTGAGVNIMVRDDGEVFSHIDFAGRLNQELNANSRGSHGDGVAGIMGGAGNLNPDYQGMAYGSTIFAVDYYYEDPSTRLDYGAAFLDPATNIHIQNDDVRVTNSSFSNGCNRGYSNIARTVDQQTFENPELMHVFSAGNMGFEDCGYGAGNGWGNITGGHKQGKNVIAVANTDFQGILEGSSSRGPALDGRIKPEIAANGFNHISTDESQGYMVFGGTSAAAPVVAGVMAVLHEAHEDIVGSRAPAALLKTIMMNAADDRGNPGPDFQFGFGLLNARKALSVLQEGRFREGIITQDEEATISIPTPDNAKGIKIMTYWPDPEAIATESRLSALVNDIDTKIEIGDDVFLPYVLNPFPEPDSLNQLAQPGIDRLNNMEQIELELNGQDQIDLLIEGFNIPFGQVTYYVTWEYITDEIVVTYPNGGENLEARRSEYIYWDADGNDGFFELELLDANNDVLRSASVVGSLRMSRLRMPSNFTEGVKIRVSRNGFSDTSDSSFVVSRLINRTNLDKDEGKSIFSWDAIEGAESYNIYALGEKYMEKVTLVDSIALELPEDSVFRNTFIAVSPNFPSGMEGKRTQAIRTDRIEDLIFTNSVNDTPCLREPFTVGISNPNPYYEYSWNFGNRAIPRTEASFFLLIKSILIVFLKVLNTLFIILSIAFNKVSLSYPIT